LTKVLKEGEGASRDAFGQGDGRNRKTVEERKKREIMRGRCEKPKGRRQWP